MKLAMSRLKDSLIDIAKLKRRRKYEIDKKKKKRKKRARIRMIKNKKGERKRIKQKLYKFSGRVCDEIDSSSLGDL